MISEKNIIDVDYKKNGLEADGLKAELTSYLYEISEENGGRKKRPAVIIFPGGGYDYCFTPTGLGMLAEVRCACGAKINVDDI